MSYYMARTIDGNFEQALGEVIDALKKEEFGVLTDIDVAATMKQKLGVEFRRYRILGACNPTLAHKALAAEGKIGVMLPCNVIVQDAGAGRVEVATIDPKAGMERVGNPALASIAEEVSDKLRRVLASL